MTAAPNAAAREAMVFASPSIGPRSAAAASGAMRAAPMSAPSKATKMAMPEKPLLMKKPPSKRAPARRTFGATRGAMAATRERDSDVEGVHDENDVSSAAVS